MTSLLQASTEEINKLFKNYELIMENKKTKLIPETFTEHFIKNSGGIKKFESNIRALKATKVKKKLSFVPSKNSSTFYVDYGPEKTKESTSITFIVIKEKGKLKIDGTMINEE